MEQLTLEQAAVKYDTDNFAYPTPGSNVIIPETTARQWNINAFTAGAEWQKEQDRELLAACNEVLRCLENINGREYERAILIAAINKATK